jgi:hypothetical protein
MNKGMKDNRIEQRMQREIENLHGNEAFTAGIDDKNARILLDWAEKNIKNIVDSTAGLEDTAAEEIMYPRLKALRRIARYVNQAVEGPIDPFELGQKIVGQLQDLYGESYTGVDTQKVQALLSLPKAEPEVIIQVLIHLFEGDMDGEEDPN